jgi:hypothetical protein
MYKKAKILLFCMIFVARGAFCQDFTSTPAASQDLYTYKLQNCFNKYASVKEYLNNSKWEGMPERQTWIGIQNFFSCRVLVTADFYTRNFGFFCKKELQLEKVTRVPLRFRLGSLQYNDYLEQKPNAVNPY